MQRFTISLDDDLAAQFDALIERRGYDNRSEAFRDLLRGELAQENITEGRGSCVGVVSYAYNHEARTLSNRMVEHQHSHLGLVIATLHVHVSAEECVEAVVMRGPVTEIKKLAAETIAETGIEHGSAHFIPLSRAAVEAERQALEHDAFGEHAHSHDHHHPHAKEAD